MRHSASKKNRSFPFVARSLVGAYYLQPPDARVIILHNDLLCNGTCSATGGRITYLVGGTNGKDPKKNLILYKKKFSTKKKQLDF